MSATTADDIHAEADALARAILTRRRIKCRVNGNHTDGGRALERNEMSEQNNIPDAAVEAAAREFAELTDPLGKWDQQAESYRAIYRRRAQCILEAAAPHMLADAWEEGRNADDFSVSIRFETNPYRPTP